MTSSPRAPAASPTTTRRSEAAGRWRDRMDERAARLTRAYGAEWLERVRALPPGFAVFALAAANARLDGWTEERWYAQQGQVDADLARALTLKDQPYADADNLYQQALGVLRDEGLWPWLLTPL